MRGFPPPAAAALTPQRQLFGTEFFQGGLPLRVIFHRQKSDEIPHLHDFHELVLVRNGSADHVTPEGKQAIRRGALFLIPPNRVHTYENVRDLQIVNLIYDPERLGLPLLDLPSLQGYQNFFEVGPRLLGSMRRHNGVVLPEPALVTTEARLHHMEGLQKEQPPAWKFDLVREWMSLLAEIAHLREVTREPPAVDRLGRVLRFIESHYPETLVQRQLAEIIGVSESTLQRLFKKFLGAKPMEVLNQRRVEKAAEFLETTDMSVGEIARAVGFTDSNYFSKVFHRAFARSPRDFRKASRTP